MPAKNVRATLVYLPPEVRDRYQGIADWESISISAVCRRILVEEDRQRQAADGRLERPRRKPGAKRGSRRGK